MLAERSETIGEATNNVAEYRALLLGIELAKELGADEAEFVADSQADRRAGARQLEGEAGAPAPAAHQVRDALGISANWSIRHVKRGDNERADELFNDALDAAA